jgi:beta-phosphoglucomutase-like phosphatase (HAD superfamily)
MGMNYNWAAMTIKSLLFDFDGLILDTETTEIDVWRTIYSEYGFEFPFDRYIRTVGGWGISTFDPADNLHQLVNDSLDVEALRLRYKEDSGRRLLAQPMQSGVQDYLTGGRRLNLRLAIASSSRHAWVEPHLTRLGLIHYFEKIICGDDVPPGRTKPNPDIFLKALDELGITAAEAIVFEDSPNGVAAAHAAGIFVVAVPNPTTSLTKIEGADLTVKSLASLSLNDLIKHVNR